MQDSLAWAPSILFSPAQLEQRQSRLDNPDSIPPSLEARASQGLGEDNRENLEGRKEGPRPGLGHSPLIAASTEEAMRPWGPAQLELPLSKPGKKGCIGWRCC